MEKMKVYFPVDSEIAVREVFAKFHEELGYPKILKFEHYPIRSTKQGMFEHLVNSVEFPSSTLVKSLIKEFC